jgi:hypothetical protein
LNRSESDAGSNYDTVADSHTSSIALSSSKYSEKATTNSLGECGAKAKVVESKPARPSVHWRTRARQSLIGDKKDKQDNAAEGEKGMIDMKWGTLFDQEGKTTERLGEVLRGLAKYIVRHCLNKICDHTLLNIYHLHV